MTDNKKKEKKIIREVLKRAENGWSIDADMLVLKYLDSFIQDGIDTITDDGYPLYLDDVKKEIMEDRNRQITDKDILKIAVSALFDDDQEKKNITKRIQKSLSRKYDGYAPAPKRSFIEYVSYADNPNTQKEYEKSYQEYAEAIDGLYAFCYELMESVQPSKKAKRIQSQSIELDLFLYELEQMKKKDFFRSITYGAYYDVKQLFYQDFYLSEDSNRVLSEVLSQPIDYTERVKQSNFNYSLEELYQTIPKDIISFELLENEEIDPNHNNMSIPFFQKFYQLALMFCQDAAKSEDFEEKINQFLIQKISNFQDRFFDSYSIKNDENEDSISYLKDKEYVKKRISK